MDNHPIPQDVTGFQFRLIGDITVKQFAYLAGAAVLCWLIFILPITLFLKIPLILLFGGLGLALAFLPFEGRPFDVMLGNFLKAFFSPNQFIFQKAGGQLTSVDLTPKKMPKKHEDKHETPATTSTSQMLDSYLRHSSSPKTDLDKKEEQFFSAVLPATQPIQPTNQGGFHIPFVQHHPQLETPIPTPPVYKPEQEKPVAVEPVVVPTPPIIATEPIAQPAPTPVQPATSEPVAPPAPVQKAVPPPNIPKGPLPISPDVPNLIVGIIRDSRGAVLPNMLVEIKDQDNNPVRAFKTNQLGQFASATPLLTGSYVLTFEDPKGTHKFQDQQLVVNGQLIAPLEVFSTDAREDLRKELFG